MTVLVAVADDNIREQVLAVGIKLGRSLDRELYVVHLTDEELADNETRHVRDELRDELAGRGVAFSVAIEHLEREAARSSEAIGRQLAEIATDIDIDHAVVGHRSKGVVERLTAGNTAFAVADAATVPVTVVPEGVDHSLTD